MKIVLQHLPQSLPDKTQLKEALSQNRILAALAAVLLGGVVCGALLSAKAGLPTLKKLDFLFNSNYTLHNGSSLLSVFFASAASSFVFILTCFLCGLSVWGALLVPFVPFIRGIGLGMTSGYLYTSYGLHGGIFYAVILLPGAFCSCLAILWAAKEAQLFSHRLSRAGLSEEGVPPKFIKYLSQFARILALAFLGAGADTFFSWAFAGYLISWL
ncbi:MULTISPECIES: stage II sporulation protein M [Caproicibacterium]|jgi:stage II sporulation protein M|uniref:Stage II sporulation protein M n=1 Tax=Caproicibacterium lactatifermentans TaxID=2666138 RepID=A0A859DQ40_9FIRM|nr:stage II sporulation protein M [Caproicibacterium lactatifermentans]ARP50320.1 hypothetical protein B6259_05185 [Ruminococcaceae bacterium CPB6]QKN23958.1 hypothetical protein GJQ69_05350 [Caproicibacterium lactatifermentans]QKO30970.1 hypothetical protein GKP14_08190 [Caproicibacterium lactatifermentans]